MGRMDAEEAAGEACARAVPAQALTRNKNIRILLMGTYLCCFPAQPAEPLQHRGRRYEQAIFCAATPELYSRMQLAVKRRHSPCLHILPERSESFLKVGCGSVRS